MTCGLITSCVIGFLATYALYLARGGGRVELFLDGWTAAAVTGAAGDLGLPLMVLARYVIVLEVLVLAVYAVAAVLVLRGTGTTGPGAGGAAPTVREQVFRHYLAAVLVFHGCFHGSVPALLAGLYPGLGFAPVLQALAWILLIPVAYVFPDGRFVPRWTRFALAVWLLLLLGAPIAAGAEADAGAELLVGAVGIAVFASCVYAQIHRFRTSAEVVERQQISWLTAAVGLRFVYVLVVTATPLGPLMDEPSARGLVTYGVMFLVSYAISAVFAVAITVAVLRYRLYGGTVLVSRALVYLMLSAAVVVAYALAVGAAGVFLHGRGGVWLPLIATAAVAVGFHPLRLRAQRRVNRLLYGQRDDPYGVVSAVGADLDAGPVPPRIVQTLAVALKLPYVALSGPASAVHRDPGVPEPAADAVVSFPLDGGDLELGTLDVLPRRGERLSAADRRLLSDVARQAGLALRAVRLAEDLDRSRRRIVLTREQERDRLHRDLHDGLGPTLSSLHQRLDAAARLIEDDPAAAGELVRDARDRVRATIDEIREIALDLRPPDLDQFGLYGAVAALVERADLPAGGATVTLTAAELPQVPPGVDVAAYRVVSEALTNALRHARADRIEVSLGSVTRDGATRLVVEVTDDGTGFEAGGARAAGTGLGSMAARAEEVGGSTRIGPRAGKGTVFRAEFPVPDPSTALRIETT